MSQLENEPLEPLWQAVQAGWDNPKTHQLFLQSCAESGALGFAAARYRAELHTPERQSKAKEALEKVQFLALQAVQAQAQVRPEAPRKSLYWMAGLLCVLALFWLAYALFRTR